MQGLMDVGFIFDEILRVGFKNDKVTRARNIGHGHDQCGCKVGTSRRSHMQGLMVVFPLATFTMAPRHALFLQRHALFPSAMPFF